MKQFRLPHIREYPLTSSPFQGSIVSSFHWLNDSTEAYEVHCKPNRSGDGLNTSLYVSSTYKIIQ